MDWALCLALNGKSLARVTVAWRDAIGGISWHLLLTWSRYVDNATAQEGVSQKARTWVDHCFGLIENRLADSKTTYASGDDFTVADIFLWVMYRWGYLLKIDMEKQYPSWTKLAAEVVKREAVKAAVEKEGIPMIRDNRAPPEYGTMHDRGF